MLHEVTAQVRKIAETVVEAINTSMPAKITAFDSETGMANVLPYGKYVKGDKVYNYPHISGVPVVFPQCSSKNVRIAFPVRKGDDCLLIFSQEELDNWLYGTQDDSTVKFDLTSAIAIPGLSKKGSEDLKEACNEDAVIISTGDNKIKVSKNGTTVYGNLTVEGDISLTGEVKNA